MPGSARFTRSPATSSGLLTRVQFHPERADVLPRLLAGLHGLDVEVVEHSSDPPNPLEGYLQCLRDIPAPVTHLLVVQDDATVCANFAAALPLLKRDVPVCLFLNGTANARTKPVAFMAMAQGRHWVELVHSDLILPVVAVLWPVAKIEHFLSWWAAQRPRRTPDRSDDSVCGRWMQDQAQKVLATLPSLVEHLDDVPSFTRQRRQRPYRRHALQFIGERDPLLIDW